MQLFDWSTTARTVAVAAANIMSKSKTVPEMTAIRLDECWETKTPLMHNSYNDGVIQQAVWILASLSSCENSIFQWRTNTSSLRIVVQILTGLFTNFQSHGMSGWFVPKIVKSCLNYLPKLRPKYLGPFFRTRCIFITCNRPKPRKKLTIKLHWAGD